MIRTDLWQNKALDDVIHLFEKVNNIDAVILIGSFANKDIQPDEWSDLDFVVIVGDNSIDSYYSSVKWFSPFGELFAIDKSSINIGKVVRICLKDFRRFDFLFLPASSLRTLDSWKFNPFQDGYKVIFSKINNIDSIISQIPRNSELMKFSDDDFNDKVNNFWFKATIAVYKVVRNDLLIASHLALDLIRKCLVLKMKLRDRSKGCTFHRTGDGNGFVSDLNSENIILTRSGILEIIENCSIQFDSLAGEVNVKYKEKRYHLIEWINHARDFVGDSNG